MEINYDLSEQVCINYCYFIHVKVNVMILYGLEEFENEFWFIIIFYMILLNWLMGHLKAESMPGALFFTKPDAACYNLWQSIIWDKLLSSWPKLLVNFKCVVLSVLFRFKYGNGNKSKVYRIEPMIEFSHKDCVFHNKWLCRKGIKVIFWKSFWTDIVPSQLQRIEFSVPFWFTLLKEGYFFCLEKKNLGINCYR